MHRHCISVAQKKRDEKGENKHTKKLSLENFCCSSLACGWKVGMQGKIDRKRVMWVLLTHNHIY